MGRINLEISDELHMKLKEKALNERKGLYEYIEEILKGSVERESEE